MPKKPLHRLPLDSWFDDVPHPYDTWPVAKDLDLDDHIPYPYDGVVEETIHEKMYRLATKNNRIGGSEAYIE
tara:strand:- start:287 stop:502 length:216 start_codon:yes stop_codon:yes gene_type:complete